MEKMRMESVDMTEKNIEKIESLFPNCITETLDENGKLKKAINFEVLKQMLSKEIIDGDEAYEFTWVGKKAAIVEANKPIRKTLRPCIEQSVDWENTENLYIEGDNLDVLKLLQESYLDSVDLIYIDPPYNTGKDILYKNNYSQNQEEYDDSITTDSDGNKLYINTETNGFFHSDWLSMMYSRLKVAYNLLSDNGFLVIAIDHNELFNLGSICDEIFGYSNRIGIISVVHKPEGRNQAKFIGPSNEFMLIYAKNESVARLQDVVLDPKVGEKFNLSDEISRYRLQNFIRLTDGKLAYRNVRPNFWYPIYVDLKNNILSVDRKSLSCDAVPVYPITKAGIEMSWKVLSKSAQLLIKKGELDFNVDEDGFITIMEKIREKEVIKSHWVRKEYNAIQYGTKVVNELLEGNIFDFPKSIYLVEDVIKLCCPKNGLVMDFFSGSGTTAHSVILANSKDGGNRRFIMTQIPASCDTKSNAFKNGYTNICEIGKERIRRAGKKIIQDNSYCGKRNSLDVGFRVLTLDESNMNNIYYDVNEYSQYLLPKLEYHIKSDRNDLDLLFGCLLEGGLPLSLPHNLEDIEGCTVHNYNNGDLVACFNENIPDLVIKYIAKKQPLRVVFRDCSFANSSSKINVFEIFKLLAPDTRVKVI